MVVLVVCSGMDPLFSGLPVQVHAYKRFVCFCGRVLRKGRVGG